MPLQARVQIELCRRACARYWTARGARLWSARLVAFAARKALGRPELSELTAFGFETNRAQRDPLRTRPAV